MLYHLFLTLHLAALIVMAGTTLIDYIAYQTFWKLFDQKKEVPTDLLQLMNKLPRLLGIGAAVIITTGIGMMALTNGVFGEQLWFRIKFGLVVLIILNGLLAGRGQGIKLRKLLNEDIADVTGQISRVRVNLSRFHLMQLAMFLAIIFLSVFKFN
ncbi:hypothetical protein [Mucilaginibacter sp. UYCu711]|uniref:hypothetical protein n=1 Tax=Mucilaginibacter sp. UYCu711 TaxID=3156339 RepID=UPI003D24F176